MCRQKTYCWFFSDSSIPFYLQLGNFNCLAHSETISVCVLLTFTTGSTVAGSPRQLDREHLDPPKRDAPAGLGYHVVRTQAWPGLPAWVWPSLSLFMGISLWWVRMAEGRGEGCIKQDGLLHHKPKWRKKAPNSRGRRHRVKPSTPAWCTTHWSPRQLSKPQWARIVGEETDDLHCTHW